MSYVFDNGPFSMLFRNFFPTVFTSLWENFDSLIASEAIVSTREVAREIEGSPLEELRAWATDHPDVFPSPTAQEAAFVSEIYGVPHFQQNIETQKVLKGGLIADPFVIAKARVESKILVTTEKFKPNAAKIPNICQHFAIPCLSVQEFMESEGWRF
jgi:hypothetical protein